MGVTSDLTSDLKIPALFIPCAMNVLVLIRLCCIKKHMDKHEIYLQGLEKKLDLDEETGWKLFLEKERSKGPRFMHYCAALRMGLLTIGSLLFPIIYILRMEITPFLKNM